MFYKMPTIPLPKCRSVEAYETRAKQVLREYNFDCPEAVDWEMLNEVVKSLIAGKSCFCPKFNEIYKISYVPHT